MRERRIFLPGLVIAGIAVDANPDRNRAQSCRRTPARLLVSLATYDEAANLRPLVDGHSGTVAPHASILIIDDNSPDGNGQDRQAKFRRNVAPTFTSSRGQASLGSGTAVLAGMKFAIEQQLRLLPQSRCRLQPPALGSFPRSWRGWKTPTS